MKKSMLLFISFLVVTVPSVAQAVPQNPPLACASYITIIADSGLIVSEFNPDERRPPASMVKMIMLLLVAEGLEDGKWTLDTQITVSAKAQSMGGTQVQLKAGETFSLEHLMKAVAVASANDGAYAVAEGLWGTAEKYLERANERAAELGMLDTVFRSVHGLPPDPGQLADESSARDLAILASKCVQLPQIMEWVSLPELAFRAGQSSKPNTNKLLSSLAGCDGLKTGYTRAAGFCLTATAVRNDVRLITVVMGCPRLRDRFEVAAYLLEDAFAQTKRVKLLAKGAVMDPAIPLANAKQSSIRLAPAQDIWITAKETDFPQMRFQTTLPPRLQAPLRQGENVGVVKIDLAGQTLATVPLLVPSDIEEPGWRWKLTHHVLGRIQELSSQEFGG